MTTFYAPREVKLSLVERHKYNFLFEFDSHKFNEFPSALIFNCSHVCQGKLQATLGS
jgi:hypothetical protein